MCTENDIRVSQVTESAAEWVARQITEAFPWNESPRYVIRDRDRIYGTVVTRRLRAMGIRDKPIAPSSLAERLIGSIRRECLDHIIVFSEAHLRWILKSYAGYYNSVRTHRSLHKDAPISRPIHRPEAFVHTRSLVDFITSTSESRFSVHTSQPHGCLTKGLLARLRHAECVERNSSGRIALQQLRRPGIQAMRQAP